MSSVRSYLLEAPEDVRRLIYKAYVAPPGGLFYDFETGRLRNSDDEFIELALMRTCKLIAREMDGIHLRENVIHFKTYYAADLSRRINIWNRKFKILTKARCRLLAGTMSSLAITDTLDNIAPPSSWFKQTLTKLMATSTHNESTNVENRMELLDAIPAPSSTMKNEAVLNALRLASAAGEIFRDEGYKVFRRVDAYVRRREKENGHQIPLYLPNPFHVTTYKANPWDIPEKRDTEALSSLVQPFLYNWLPCKEDRYDLAGMERVSAAAASIRFLDSLSDENRGHLRKLDLLEDHPSSETASMHAAGLVPFCMAHPRLRITRRVLVWDCIWASSVGQDTLWGDAILSWVAEATALTKLGMSAGSFSLIFDGQYAPDQASEIFQQFVHREVAWSQAMEQMCTQHGWTRRQGCHCSLAEAMADIVAGSSNIRCNFDPGRPWDVQHVLQNIQGLRRRAAVFLAHRQLKPKYFDPRDPLPSSRDELVHRRDGYPVDTPLYLFRYERWSEPEGTDWHTDTDSSFASVTSW